MASLIIMAEEYRNAGHLCRERMKELKDLLSSNKKLGNNEICELRRRITLLTAMSRECVSTANFLKNYYERREYLDKAREEN